ncbi:hypothetical protein ABTE27_20655, partial [Acinetobacter baumannii]
MTTPLSPFPGSNPQKGDEGVTRPDRIWRLAADGRVIAQDVPDAGGAETSAQRVHWRELWRDENRASAE